MIENSMENTSISAKKIVLQLFGSDKRWIRSQNGQWIDENEILVQSTMHVVDEDDYESEDDSKRWWQFWKK